MDGTDGDLIVCDVTLWEGPLIICIAEDRPSFEPAVRLLLLSLMRHCPNLSIRLFFPPAKERFFSWVKRYDQVKLDIEPLPTVYSHNVKPQALLHLIDEGHDDIVWVDSDIIVNQDICHLFKELDPEVLVVTEEAMCRARYDPDGFRARLWGFKVGRIHPFVLNTGIIRSTRSHRALLSRWRELLESDQYAEFQRLDWRSRPPHMIGDQDVLTALLASEEYANVPLKVLKRGKDIIQYFGAHGYTISERLSNVLFGGPSFIHSQGPKPWIHDWQHRAPKSVRRTCETLYLDLSPYTLTAWKYRDSLDSDTSWMQPHSIFSAFLRGLGCWYSPLAGLPFAAAADLLRLAGGFSASKGAGTRSASER
jgi:hypothetical protein